MPFWFVNGGMDYDEMAYQLKEYKDKASGHLFPFPLRHPGAHRLFDGGLV